MSGPLVIELSGEYDIAASANLTVILRPAEDATYVVLDFDGVSYIDSSAVTVLVRLHKQRLAKDLPLMHLARVTPQVTRVFELTDLSTIWPMYETVEDAVAAFSAEANS